MAVNTDEILDAISKMSLMEVVELISDMEKKFGVTAAAPVAVAAAAGAGAAAAAPAEEKTEFNVTLKEYPADKSCPPRSSRRWRACRRANRRWRF